MFDIRTGSLMHFTACTLSSLLPTLFQSSITTTEKPLPGWEEQS